MQETKRRLHVSPSLVIAILALVIASTSGAYAAVTIAAKNSVVSKSIKNGNVKSADLAKNSVNTKKIKDGQVMSADIGDGQVTSADIGDGQIGAADFAPTALGNYYTKAQSDASYYSKTQSDANYYTKAQADAKYAPYPKVFRGVLSQQGYASSGSQLIGDSYDFGGATFAAAPTVHVITPGGILPVGCAGTVAAPDALPGHLCIFENIRNNVDSETVCSGANVCGAASPFGFLMVINPTAAGLVDVSGSWAARPSAAGIVAAAPAAPAPANKGGAGSATGR